MTTIYPYWRKIHKPEAGLYQIQGITGFEIDGDPTNRVVLYVCTSMNGYLSEAFSEQDIGKTWQVADFDADEAITRGIRNAFHNNGDFLQSDIDQLVIDTLAFIHARVETFEEQEN